MKCPKCGYNSFEYLDRCKKCGSDLAEFKAKYNLRSLFPLGKQSAAHLTPESDAAENSLLAEVQTPAGKADFGFDFMDDHRKGDGNSAESSLESLLDEGTLPEEPEEKNPVGETEPAEEITSADFKEEGVFAGETVGFDLLENEGPSSGVQPEPQPLEEIGALPDEEFFNSTPQAHETPAVEQDLDSIFEPESELPPLKAADKIPDFDLFDKQTQSSDPFDAFSGESAPDEPLSKKSPEPPSEKTLDEEKDEDLTEASADSFDEAIEEKTKPSELPEKFDPPAELTAQPENQEEENLFAKEPEAAKGEAEQIESSLGLEEMEKKTEAVTVHAENEPVADPPDSDSGAKESPRAVASLFLRIGAFATDQLILGLVFALFLIAGEVALFPGEERGLFPKPETLLDLSSPYFLVLFILCFGYFTLFHFLTGQTPGKMLFRLRVEGEQGAPLLFSQAFLRSAGGLLCLLPAGLGYMATVIDKERRGWNDRLAGTQVVPVTGLQEKELNQLGEVSTELLE
jgi:uncharacterized RDD family membrane protein YckC